MSIYSSAVGLVLVRALGLAAAVVLTMVVAHRFGSDRQTDIVFNALVIPSVMTGVIYSLLPPVFVSIFKSLEVGHGPYEAWAFGRSAVRVMTAGAAGVAVAGILLSPFLAQAVSPGFTPAEVSRVGQALRIAFLLVPLAVSSSVLRGLLNAQGSFVLPSSDTLLANLVAIVVILLGAPQWGASAIVIGAVAGSAVRVAIQLPGYPGGRQGVGGPFLHPAVKQAWGQLWPVVLAGALIAVGAAFIRSLASKIPGDGPVSYLNYAERIHGASNELVFAPLGILFLPSLAGHAAAREFDRLRERVTKGMRLSTFLGIPAAVGLVLLAEPTVALVCQRGHFGADDATQTAQALRGYAVSLALSGGGILQQAFYALGQTRHVLFWAAAFIGGITIAGALLVGAYGVAGLGAAYGIGSACGFLVSLCLFGRRAGLPDLRGLLSGALRTSLCAGAMGAVVWALPGVHVLGRAAIGAAVFALLARFACPEEWRMTRKLWSRTEPS